METQPSILVIDDEVVIRDTLEMLLSNEYRLYFAENGVDGFLLALQMQPDIMLLDVMMPRMDGFEVCQRVRATPILADMPIIMITALDDRESRLKGLRAGADDFISKPFDSLELLARVQTITRLNRYRHLVEQRNQLEQAHRDLLSSYTKTIEGWVHALDLRDKETEGHSQRVTQMTVEFARSLGVSQEKLEDIRIGALLHDVGKLGVPDAILLKPGKLTPEEWEVMHKHPEHAYKWLASIDFLLPALDIPYCHHEKWDGSGYPRGLSGEDIPLAARLFTIVDVWDACRSNRLYRAAMPESEVLEYLRAESGKHFDPSLVDTFISLQHAT
ncbi:MAG: response regulator [Chloroflexi bacterium]|nr:response regulator [Chloroflexota bacterium]